MMKVIIILYFGIKREDFTKKVLSFLYGPSSVPFTQPK